MENFFGHLKEEMYYRRDYRNVEELENADQCAGFVGMRQRDKTFVFQV